jgi:hypothetical protein
MGYSGNRSDYNRKATVSRIIAAVKANLALLLK